MRSFFFSTGPTIIAAALGFIFGQLSETREVSELKVQRAGAVLDLKDALKASDMWHSNSDGWKFLYDSELRQNEFLKTTSELLQRRACAGADVHKQTKGDQ